MAAINLANLDSVFLSTQGETVVLGKSTYRFRLIPGAQVQAITQVITTFLENNPNLVLVSRPRAGENLGQKVTQCPNLIINGDAVCLSAKPKAPDHVKTLVRDIFFSQALIDVPIQCSRNHPFELEHIRTWVEAKGNNCPYGEPHVVGTLPLTPDDVHVETVRSEIASHERLEETRAQTANANAHAVRQDVEMASLRGTIQPNWIGECAGAGAKIAYKIATPIFFEESIKQIPFVSILFGFTLATYRFSEAYKHRNRSEAIKGLLEIASSLLACFPGGGTEASILLDLALAGHDVYIGLAQKKSLITTAHKILGLDPQRRPSREELDRAARERSRSVHPDPMSRHGRETEAEMNNVQSMVNSARDLLYKHYGYDQPQNGPNQGNAQAQSFSSQSNPQTKRRKME